MITLFFWSLKYVDVHFGHQNYKVQFLILVNIMHTSLIIIWYICQLVAQIMMCTSDEVF